MAKETNISQQSMSKAALQLHDFNSFRNFELKDKDNFTLHQNMCYSSTVTKTTLVLGNMVLVVLFYDALKTSIPTRIQDYYKRRQHQHSRTRHCRLFPNCHCDRLPDVPRCLSVRPISHCRLNIEHMQSNKLICLAEN